MDEKDRKIKELEEKVEALRTGADIEFSEGVRRRTLQDIISAGTNDAASTSNINQSIAADAAFTSSKEFDRRLRVEIDGTDYYIGLYTV